MKKETIPIIIFILICILGVTIFIILSMKNNNHKNYEIIEISYSYGGGFGTVITTSEKEITFSSNGEVKLSNKYNSYTESFTIDQSKYNELKEIIIDNISLFDEKPKEDKEVSDGGYSTIQIKLKDGQIKKNGGYMIKNKKYAIIENKIYEIIDYKRLDQYEKNIEINE